MILELKLFTDLIDALGKVAGGLKALVNLPKAERATLAGTLAGAVSAKDWDGLLQQMRAILATEGEVALFIGQQFQLHASDARSAGQDTKRTQSIRDALAAFRIALIAERQELIKQELELYTLV